MHTDLSDLSAGEIASAINMDAGELTDEPVFNFLRVSGDLQQLYRQNAITALDVHSSCMVSELIIDHDGVKMCGRPLG